MSIGNAVNPCSCCSKGSKSTCSNEKCDGNGKGYCGLHSSCPHAIRGTFVGRVKHAAAVTNRAVLQERKANQNNSMLNFVYAAYTRKEDVQGSTPASSPMVVRRNSDEGAKKPVGASEASREVVVIDDDSSLWSTMTKYDGNKAFHSIMKQHNTKNVRCGDGMGSHFADLAKCVSDGPNIICLLCAELGKATLLKRKNNNSASFSSHLQSAHRDLYVCQQKLSTKSVYASAGVNQVAAVVGASLNSGTPLSIASLDSFLVKRMNAPEKMKHHENIAMWVAQEQIPPNILKSKSFRKVISDLSPSYSAPTVDYITDRLAALQVSSDAEIMKSLKRTADFHGLSVTKFLNLLWDGWTKGKSGFLGIGGVWYDPFLKALQYAVFGVAAYKKKRHTAEESRQLLREVLRKYELEEDNLLVGIADGAAVGVGKTMGFVDLRWCICHVLQLAVVHGAAIQKFENHHWQECYDILRKISFFCQHLQHSTQGHAHFMSLQGIAIEDLSLDAEGDERTQDKASAAKRFCATRWGGVFQVVNYMSRPVVYKAYNDYHAKFPSHLTKDAKKNLVEHMLSPVELSNLTSMGPVLYPFFYLSKIFQGEKYATAPYYVYFLEQLKFKLQSDTLRYEDAEGNARTISVEELDEFAKMLRSRLLQEVSERVKYSDSDLLSFLMHPGFKTFRQQFRQGDDYPFQQFKETAIQLLRTEYDRYTVDTPTPEKRPVAPKRPVATDDDDDDEVALVDDAYDVEEEASQEPNEIDEYLKLKVIIESTAMKWVTSFDVFNWWEQHRSRFPILYKIAIRYLSIPCASSFCERIFSTGGLLSSCCSTDTIERRIQLAHNLHILQNGCCTLLSADLKINLEPLDNVDDKHDEDDPDVFLL